MTRPVSRRICSPQLWCTAFLLLVHGCKGTEPTPPPTTGDLLVAATTTGVDLDPDGYTVALDSASSGVPHTLAVNGTVKFSQLSPGNYSVRLLGSTTNCIVADVNPQIASVTAGQTTQVTFQISCVQRVDVSGVWNYTERLGSAPLACNDTGSYVFTPSGDGFAGTNDQVGTCDQQDGSIDNSSLATVAGAAVQYSSSSEPRITFSLGSCSYSAKISGTPPARLINGSADCPSGPGTWEAVKGGGSVQSVTVSPPTGSVVAGGTVRLRAVLIDASGSRRVGGVTWTSDAPARATVDAAGLVTGVAPGSATITAAAETRTATATVSVEVVTFAMVQAGAYHSCALTPSGGAYCWGGGTYGEIGDGDKGAHAAPVALAGGLTLAAISVGAVHTCGLLATGAAYCWGLDLYGELGAGVPAAELCGSEGAECSTVPLAVAGGNSFSSVSTGWDQSCALTSSGAAYCWGEGIYGALGDGSKTNSRTPVPVTGGLTFASIGTGTYFACGLTAGGAAYCWGNNTAGQLGTGTASAETCNGEPCSTTPVAVSGGLTFTALSVGYWHACGLTSSGTAYCWGDNDGSQLGAVTTETCSGFGTTIGCSRTPLAVATNLTFAQISAGSFHSCGLTPGGEAYCWGANRNGQLGNATSISSPFPSPVAGGLSFGALSAFGRWHSCGLSAAGVAYCWGYNGWGQLGDGTTFEEHEPVRVLGQAAASATATRRVASLGRASAQARPKVLSARPPGP
jgi:alpha-tubulin suppressor-like RCC1 family protein